MKSLSNYIKKVNWDSHIHLFNASKPLISLYKPLINNCVGFADIEFNDIDSYNDHMVELYKKYIENNWNSSQILLATAPTPEEAIEVYKKFPDKIKGFGELKLYDEYRGVKINYKKISYARSICKFSEKNGNLPVYIHYSLISDDDVTHLKNLLKDYPSIPIVLCHCGIDNNVDNKLFAYYNTVNLMNEYSNLWADISYTALSFFNDNPFRILNMKTDRLLIGSDVTLKNFTSNHKNPEKHCDEIYKMIDDISSYCNFDLNLKRLFGI